MKRFLSIFQQQQNPPPGAHGMPGSGQGGLPGASPLSPPTQHRNIDYVHPTLKQKLRSNEKKFHMRVVIRGDRGCGKTQLFKRLRGEGFDEVYNPSATLKSGYVHWNYKSIDDVIVLELWDVPDSSKKKTTAKLKLQHGQESSDEDTDSSTGSDSDEEQPDFESAFEQEMKQMLSNGAKIEEGSHMFSPNIHTSMIDIYKNTHCVIIMINPLKRASWKFAKRQVRKVPKGIDIAFLLNFKDREKEHKINMDEVSEWSSNFEAESHQKIHIMEASMKDCYGLKNLFTYFNIPFCRLKMETVRKELKRLEEELKANIEEVDLNLQSASYTQHKNWLAGGNSPEGSVPFLRELGQSKITSAKGVPSPPIVKGKEEPPTKSKVPEKSTKSEKADKSKLDDIPEHIKRKYDLLLTQPTVSVKSNSKITSVDEFKIEGSNDGFWGDDSDSDSDKSESAPVVSTAGLLPDELSSDEDKKKKSKSSEKKRRSHRSEKKHSRRLAKSSSDDDSDNSEKESKRKKRRDRRKEKSKPREKSKKETPKPIVAVEESASDSSEEEIRAKRKSNAQKTEKNASEKSQKESLEKERLEKEKLEQERLEQERQERERLERIREEEIQKQLEKEREEKEREDKQRLEAERLEKERLEKEARLAMSLQDFAVAGNEDFFGEEESDSEENPPSSDKDVDNDSDIEDDKPHIITMDDEIQDIGDANELNTEAGDENIPIAENPSDLSEIPVENAASNVVILPDQDSSNVVKEQDQDNHDNKSEVSEEKVVPVSENIDGNAKQDALTLPNENLNLSDSEEEVGYITRKSTSDQSDESDESDDSDSDDHHKKRSGKRGAQKGAASKRKPSKAPKVTSTSKQSISEDVLKAIREAEEQLKANVLEEQKRKEEMKEMGEKKEKKESRSKKSGERRSRTSKKDSEKRRGAGRSSRRKKSEETESDDDEED